MITLIEDHDHIHIAVWICEHCDKIHIGNFDQDKNRIAHIDIDPENLNAVIIELMKLAKQQGAKK